MPNQVRTIYIVGRGYSGSTILSSLLGDISGVQCVGELIFSMDKILCGCGEPFDECEFWQQVSREFESSTGLPWETSMEELREQAHFKYFLKTLFARRNGPYLRRLKKINDGVTAAILKIADAHIMLDSSKQPSRALLLERIQDDAQFLHIVRSPDRYLYSYMRRLERGRFSLMRRKFDVKSVNFLMFILVALSWLVINTQAEIVRLLGRQRTLRVLYEDLIEDPEKELRRIGFFTGMNVEPLLQTIRTGAEISIGHIIAGNAHMREAGVFVFDPQMGKPVRLPMAYNIMVKGICWPLMLLYGYPIMGRPESPSSSGPQTMPSA